MDLASGCWQVAMEEESLVKTVFITRNGLCNFAVMPFGLQLLFSDRWISVEGTDQ